MKSASCTGVILAGGENKRFSGTEKAFIKVGRKEVIDHIFAVLDGLFDHIIVVSNHPLRHLNRNLEIAADILPVRSSLTGIHAGLFFTMTPFAFVCACDTPFLKRGLIETLLDAVEADLDVVIPKTNAGIEPLCAVYSRRCLRPIQHLFDRRQLKIRGFFDTVRVRHVPEATLREADPDLLSFFNINTPADLETARRLNRNPKEIPN